jgi:histidyl-tRNA synthetase
LSAADRIKAPRGTSDVLGEQSSARAVLEAKARAILEGAGYERIETPTFEATELFARGVGASTDIVQKEMYTFEDASGRSLTLRPEGTAPVCRAYVEHGMHKLRQPVRLWYLSSFFRYERAQAGRYRQFSQVGLEALGSEDPAVDAESICLLATLLAEMHVDSARLRLSSLGSHGARQEHREQLQAHLRAHADSLSEDVRARIELNPLRAFDSEHPGTRQAMRTAPLLREFLSPEDAAHFAEVRARLDAAGVAYELDPTLVRGLDYYTRTVFEFTSDALGAQSGVGGGGRYDGLVEMIKRPPADGSPTDGPSADGPLTPGIGWAAGIERILLAGSLPPAAPAPVDLFVAYEPQRESEPQGEERSGDERRARAPVSAFALLSQARAAGLTAQMELAGRSLKGQLGFANALGARYVAILNADETVLKDMSGGGQETLAPEAITHAVLRGLRTL